MIKYKCLTPNVWHKARYAPDWYSFKCLICFEEFFDGRHFSTGTWQHNADGSRGGFRIDDKDMQTFTPAYYMPIECPPVKL